MPAIQSAFDLSNSAFGSVYGIATALSAVVLIYAGKKIDDIPLKKYMLFVLIGLSGFLFLASVVNSVYLLVFVFFGLRFFGQGIMTHTSITSMIKYFDKDRGKALSIAALGHPLVEAAFPLLITAIIGAFGWRYSFIFSAISVLIIVLPLAFLFLAKTKRHVSEVDHQLAESEEEKVSQLQILGDRRFYIIAPNIFTIGFLITTLFFYHLPIADFRSWSQSWMAGSLMVFALSGSLSGLIAGPLVDKLSAKRMFPFYFIPFLVGILILYYWQSKWAAPAYLLFAGISVGFGNTIKNAIQAEFFGTASIGAVRSLFTPIMVISTAAGPTIFGFVLDAGYTFDTLFLSGVFLSLLIILQSFRAWKY